MRTPILHVLKALDVPRVANSEAEWRQFDRLNFGLRGTGAHCLRFAQDHAQVLCVDPSSSSSSSNSQISLMDSLSTAKKGANFLRGLHHVTFDRLFDRQTERSEAVSSGRSARI